MTSLRTGLYDLHYILYISIMIMKPILSVFQKVQYKYFVLWDDGLITWKLRTYFQVY